MHVEGAPRLPEGFWPYVEQNGIPVLGICYGMQVLHAGACGCRVQGGCREDWAR